MLIFSILASPTGKQVRSLKDERLQLEQFILPIPEWFYSPESQVVVMSAACPLKLPNYKCQGGGVPQYCKWYNPQTGICWYPPVERIKNKGHTE